MRMIKRVSVFTAFFALLYGYGQAAPTSGKNEIQPTLPATVDFNVTWDTGEESDVRNAGSFEIHITGDLVLIASWRQERMPFPLPAKVPKYPTTRNGKNAPE